MKRQARPFTVEVKTRRRSSQSVSAQSEVALIDQPQLDVDSSRTPSPSRAGATSGIFALANSVFASAATFSDLASSVFGLRRPEPQPMPDPAQAQSGSTDRPAR